MKTDIRNILPMDVVEALFDSNNPSSANPFATINDVNPLLNNVYKITYYQIVSGASGTITPPAGTTFNADEFGLSGNAILSKIDGSNKPTYQSPTTAGGVVVTASLNTTTGAWVTSGVYTDASVALIFSLRVSAASLGNLTYSQIIETVQLPAAANPFADNTALIKNSTDNTKLAILSAANITTGTTRTYTLQDSNDTFVMRATTDTLTNKRFTNRTGTTAGSATPTINTDNYDRYTITALAANITSFTTNLTGTPIDGDILEIRINDNGTARTIAWGASFTSTTNATLPTTTVISTTIRILLEWNSTTTVWECIAVN